MFRGTQEKFKREGLVEKPTLSSPTIGGSQLNSKKEGGKVGHPVKGVQKDHILRDPKRSVYEGHPECVQKESTMYGGISEDICSETQKSPVSGDHSRYDL